MSWFRRSEERMPIIEGFDFFPLTFDDHGQLQSRQEFEALIGAREFRHRRDLHRARLSQRRARCDESLHALPRDIQGEPLSRPEFSIAGQSAVCLRRRLLAVEAVSRDLRRGKERHTRTAGRFAHAGRREGAARGAQGGRRVARAAQEPG